MVWIEPSEPTSADVTSIWMQPELHEDADGMTSIDISDVRWSPESQSNLVESKVPELTELRLIHVAGQLSYALLLHLIRKKIICLGSRRSLEKNEKTAG